MKDTHQLPISTLRLEFSMKRPIWEVLQNRRETEIVTDHLQSEKLHKMDKLQKFINDTFATDKKQNGNSGILLMVLTASIGVSSLRVA